MSQTSIETQLDEIFADARAARAFPGGVALLARDGKIVVQRAAGFTAYDDSPREYSQPVAVDTIYDVASISKLFTASAALLSMRENGIELDEKVARFLPDLAREDKREISIRQLLNHSSGIGFAIQQLPSTPPEKWLPRIAEEPLHAAIGERVIYSCTNYFLLARLIESWCGTSLNDFLTTRFLQPLQMSHSGFFPLQNFKETEIAPTEINSKTGRAWRGVVHDEAARFWESETGTACGNAGLFATAADLWNFAQLWLSGGAFGTRQLLDERDVRAALTQTVRADGYFQGLGWHLKVLSWMGTRAPKSSAGHAGFTGPTLFIVPPIRAAVIVLNNRVFPTRDGPPRFRFHRAIANCLLAEKEN